MQAVFVFRAKNEEMPTVFRISNPDYESVVRESFADQSFMQTLGAVMKTVEPGRVVITYQRSDKLLQQHGFLHAGVGTSVVDSACGYAALTLAGQNCEVLTSEFKVHFLRPASGQNFHAVGSVLKAGNVLTICEGELFQDDQEKPVAKMTATMVLRNVDPQL